MDNSKLLDKIMEMASEGGELMTEERVLWAFLCAATEITARVGAGTELKQVKSALTQAFGDIARTKRELDKHFNALEGVTVDDILRPKVKRMEAEKLAKSSGAEQVSAAHMLQAILNDPSDVIRNLMENSVPEPAEDKEESEGTMDISAQTAALEAALADFYNSMRSENGKEEKPEEKAEEKPEETGNSDVESLFDDLEEDFVIDDLDGAVSDDDPPAEPTAEADKETVAAQKETEQQRVRESEEKARAKREFKAVFRLAQLTQETKRIRSDLSRVVFGQDNAISVFASGYFRSELLAMTDAKRQRPATFLFAGPPGVGKTFLAENVAKILNRPFRRFDMSEYCDKEAAIEFCGSDGVYKNSKQGNFTEFVSENSNAVILFDEIEKAHLNIIHLFLQILDAGRIRDNYSDKEISLRDTVLIFTTNAGKQLYEEHEGDLSLISRKVILKALQADVNPTTGAPFFPAAICSRFASGNVVMFNHMGAHDLREIARKEVMRHAGNFEETTGIRVEMDERVFAALLFAEGGAADARTIRSRAEAFFDDELFELLRHVDEEENGISTIKTIRVDVEPPQEGELSALFESQGAVKTLVFASDETVAAVREKTSGSVIGASDVAAAKSILRDDDIGMILIDYTYGCRQSRDAYLNIEDVASEARDFFRFVREWYADVPAYLLQTEGYQYDAEERVSFLRAGARDILSIADESFGPTLETLCGKIHHQKKMDWLSSSNKLVRFETAQRLTEDATVAEIRLFDFTSEVAVEAEDGKDVMSNVSRPDVTFDRVIGAEDAKQEMKMFIDYLKNPKKFKGTGARAPRGLLLYGPPGTGKTMLAKALAGESGVTFISAEGNQFLKPIVGAGPDAVHRLFRTARKYAPSILFIDEIDAIAKERRGVSESDSTLTAFLTEMDGFKNDASRPVFVLAATNFDVTPGNAKSLDPALMRRFDRRVYIDLPTRDDRVKYMKLKMSANKAFDVSDEMLDNLAIRSTGMSLADLELVLEMSLRMLIRENAEKVTDAMLEEAFETYNSGEKKNWDASQLERVARHEAGHALLCWHGGETPSYLTVVARGDHGGYMQHGDHEGKAIYTREEMLARIRTSLGGRAAELVYYGAEDGVSTGAAGDLYTATRTARNLLCAYGMDDDFGLAVVEQEASTSGELSGEVRAAVNGILREQMAQAIDVIKTHRPMLDKLVAKLIERNHLTAHEMEEIFSGN